MTSFFELVLITFFIMKPVSFEDIISFENLFKAHQRARLCKQHKREVINFEANLSRNLWKLHYDLKYHKYKIGEYRKFMIYDPKEREIQAIPYCDRIVQHSVCDNLLIPLLEKHLINANCACRKGKGTDYAIKLLRHFMTEHYKKYGNRGYFIKLDIKKYFPSIDHDVLYRKLERFNFDDDTKWLLHTIIDSYGNGIGLPMGNQSSQCFALLYLDRIDRIVKERLRIKFYVRYMDDMILIDPDKDFLRNCWREIEKKLAELGLELNKKTCLYPLKQGVKMLQWKFIITSSGRIVRKMSKNKQSRQRRKLRKIYEKEKAGEYAPGTARESLVSWIANAKRGDTWYERIKMIQFFDDLEDNTNAKQ